MSVTAQQRVLGFGGFRLQSHGCILSYRDQIVPLPPKCSAMLFLLLTKAGSVVTKEELMQKIWPDAFVGESSLTRTISDLRKTLARYDSGLESIVTVSKRGYRWASPVEEIRESSTSPTAGKVMLAVLPFENLSRKSSQEYLSDGLTEEMITQLGKVNPEQLGVIARTSAMQYKASRKNIQQVGEELGVQYVLEGSIRRSGNRVRVTAQLINVADQSHMWCESYDREFGDILYLQNDVARSIAHEIKIKLAHQNFRHASLSPVVPQAYELYLKGRYLWNRRGLQALRQSLRCFEQATKVDPSYAVAYAGAADAYLTLQDQGYLLTLQATSDAKRAAARALRIDETVAEAHISLAHAYFHEFDWRAAEREFQRGIELNPNYALAHFYYANYLLVMNRFAEAIDEARMAEALDPVSLAAGTNSAAMLYFAGHYDESIKKAREILEIEPEFAQAWEDLGRACLEKGLAEEAIAAFNRAVQLSQRSPHFLASLAHAYAVAGRRKKANALLQDLRQQSKRMYVSPYAFVLTETGLGHKDEALGWLDKAYEQRSTALPFIGINPRLASLRGDPRFANLLRRLDLAQ